MSSPSDVRVPGHSSDEVSWASYLTFGWLNPMVEVGVQRQISLQDSPPLAMADDTLANTQTVLGFLGEQEGLARGNPVFWALLQSFWPQLLAMQMFNMAVYLVELLNPFVLQRLLVFQEAQNSGKELTASASMMGLEAAVSLVALGIFLLFFKAQRDLLKNRISLRITSSLKGAVVARGVEGLTRSPGNSDQAGSGSAAAIYNVISFDVEQCVDLVWVLLDVWLFPIQLTTALLALSSQVSSAIWPGLAAILLMKALNLVMGYWDGDYRDRLYFKKDERLGRCGEGFTNIRTLQMLAWTSSYEAAIAQARGQELQLQRTRLWLQKMPLALDYGLQALVSFVTLGFYVMSTGNALKASLALPVIAIIAKLIDPLGQIPMWMNKYKISRSAYDRTSRFMGFSPSTSLSEPQYAGQPSAIQPILSLHNCCFQWVRAEESQDALGMDEEALVRQPLLDQSQGMHNYGTTEPNRDMVSFELSNISLRLEIGQMLAVVGREAQGKSSLLLALLGEMHLKSGSFSGFPCAQRSKCPDSAEHAKKLLHQAACGPRPIAFASQEPWFFTGSLQANVLFGLPLVPDLYEAVLQACALKADLPMLAADDQTEIAAGGSTLSGGQRARVGLARAAYAAALECRSRPDQPPLVLLDDPFCALDRSVASEVCSSLFSPGHGLLSCCMVVVAAADPWWLRLVDQADIQLMVLRSGQVVKQGSIAELKGQDIPELQSLGSSAAQQVRVPISPEPQHNPQDDEEREEPDRDSQTSSPSAAYGAKPRILNESYTQTPLTEEQEQKGIVTQQERREAGHVRLSTYMTYLTSAGFGTFTVLLVALIGISVFQNLCNLWVIYWTSDDKSSTTMYGQMKSLGLKPPESDGDMLKVYGCLVFAFYVSNISGHAIEIVGGIRAAGDIFNQALKGTLARPIMWWDMNPTGRVLNRFSQDVDVMDKAVTTIFGVIIGALLYFISHTIVLTFSNPIAICLLPFVALLMEYFARHYRITVRELQRVYLVSISDVYQEMTDAILGGASVRAFNMKTEVLCRCLLNLQELNRAFFAKTVLGQWVSLRLGVIGLCVSISSQLYPVLQYYQIVAPKSAALVGFAITYSTELVDIIQQFIMNFSDMEMQLVSIERLKEYSEWDCQSDAPAAQQQLVASEAQQGLLLVDVAVTYREGLKPALSGVTLTFAPRETVAIVGRTGAGKSSLLLAILQLVPHKGTISVGGIVLEGLSPRARAQLVAVVPQQPVIFAGSLRWNLDPDNHFGDEGLLAALQAVGLGQVVAEHGLDVYLNARGSNCLALSVGQRQLVCAARALLQAPKAALLDEVTAALPREAALSTADKLLERFGTIGATVLLVTHQEELIPCCSRVVRLAGGRVISDESLLE